MKISKKEKAWINVKCSECGKIIYHDDVWKVRPERILNSLAEWKFCEECFNETFTKEVRENVKEK